MLLAKGGGKSSGSSCKIGWPEADKRLHGDSHEASKLLAMDSYESWPQTFLVA